MQVTFLGHSSFIFRLSQGDVLVMDPFVTPNEAARGIDVANIKGNYVFLSHGHFDHVADAEAIARANDATIVSTYEIATYYGGKGLKHHPMNIGGKWDFGKFSAKAVNAVHSSVLPDGTYAGNAMGYVIEDKQQRFYYSGDTALHIDMQLIGNLSPCPLAFLCLGDNFTMGVEDAVWAAKYVKAKKVVGMHFDTFPYIKINHEKAVAAFAAEGIQLILPEIGQTFEV
jgi:L-ascorbate metabolism protein UlaG (beta-lactamase superfamily)